MQDQSGLVDVYASMNGLTSALKNILAAVTGANAQLQGTSDALLVSLVALEIVLLGYWLALGELGLTTALKKALALGFWIWFAREFSTIAHWWQDFALGSGLKAGGMAGAFSLAKNPSAIANMAMKLTKPLVEYIMKLDLTDIPLILMLCGVLWSLLLIYLAMAINMFVAMLEFHIYAVLAALLMPFGVSPFTRFIAEKGINIVVASGVKLMTLGFVLAIVKPVLGQMKITSAADLNQLVAIVLTTAAIAFLAWHAPRMAASVVAGSPSLSASSVMGSALAAYGAVRMGWGALSGGPLGTAATRAGVSAIESASRIDPPRPGASANLPPAPQTTPQTKPQTPAAPSPTPPTPRPPPPSNPKSEGNPKPPKPLPSASSTAKETT
jgi:type IV secretion system protein TrbL